jgi:hypothetical protein
MFCPQCGASNPNGARFCIMCAASLGALANADTPVTGPTRRLDPPAPAGTGAPRAVPLKAARRRHHKQNGVTGPIFLLGLGLLFATNTFWPGIFVLLGVMAMLNAAQPGRRDGLQGLVFFGGLAFLFATGLWWPGLLLWFGALSWIQARHGHPKGTRCWW